jgi:DNA polymerase
MPAIIPDFDFESYSEAGYYWDGPANRWRGVMKSKASLPAVGTPVYTAHPSTRILSLAYDLKTGSNPEQLWTPGNPEPVDLFHHIATGGILEAWNSAFEYHLWLAVCFKRMGWPELPLDQLRCAMAKAAAFGLPGKLEKAAEVLEAPEQKDKIGKALMQKKGLFVPRNPSGKDPNTFYTPEQKPELFDQIYKYNRQDIRAESSVSAMCPDLSPFELEVWKTDQKINTRGVQIDTAGLENCITIVNAAFKKYNAELSDIMGIEITADKLDLIKVWMADRGVKTSSLDEDHTSRLLARENLPPAVRRVLEIRGIIGAASVKKLFAIQRTVSDDGRLRDIFAYHGARQTGRFAGMGAQPQNMPAGGLDLKKCDCGRVSWSGLLACRHCGVLLGPDVLEWSIEGVELALQDIASGSLDYVEKYWGDAIAAVAGCLRGLFCAADGSDLLCSDYSAIEAVVLAFMAGELWRMEVFRTHGKIYEMCASKITGVPFEEILAHKKNTGMHHKHRKKFGKVPELASGYAGWLNAWLQFGAGDYMDDPEIIKNIKKWRKDSPAIVEFWGGQFRKDPKRWHFEPELHGVEGAAILAIQNPGKCYKYGPVAYGVKGDVLYCLLPSGRKLVYHRPKLQQSTAPHGNPCLQITFEGWNSDSTKGPIGWTVRETYGGRLTENIIQAVARDILVYAMVNLEAAGYKIVLHVHDEIVVECLHGHGSIEEVERIMGQMPPWCADWPIKATGGWRGLRYRKD